MDEQTWNRIRALKTRAWQWHAAVAKTDDPIKAEKFQRYAEDCEAIASSLRPGHRMSVETTEGDEP